LEILDFVKVFTSFRLYWKIFFSVLVLVLKSLRRHFDRSLHSIGMYLFTVC
jgi:hypothetical protein